MPTLSAAWNARVKFLLWEQKRKSKSEWNPASNHSHDRMMKGGCTCLLLAAELLVWDVCRKVGMEHSTKSQAVIPTAAEVCDINVLKKIKIKIQKQKVEKKNRVKKRAFSGYYSSAKVKNHAR